MSHRIPPSFDEADCLLPLSAPRWFVVCVQGGREKRARDSLAEVLKPIGLRVYLPIEARWRRQAGRKSRAERALLPGYLFAEARDEDLHLFRDVDGVRGLLSRTGPMGPVPMPTPSAFVGWLAVAEAFGQFDATIPSVVVTIGDGDLVRITGGPMKGRSGQVLSAAKGARRVRVMLEALGVFGAGPTMMDVGMLAAA